MKTYSYKLYIAKRNKYLHRQIELAAEIYNHCIALYRLYYRFTGKRLDHKIISAHITRLKARPKYAHWFDLNSQAIQDVTERIRRTYNLFFSNRKKKIKCSPPRFRKRQNYKSFTLKQSGFKFLSGHKVRIGEHIFKYVKSREIEGKIKIVTVKRDKLGDLYLFVVTDYSSPAVMPYTGESVGYDFGLKTFLKASDGNDIESPLFFQENFAIIKKAHRELSRKEKGSNHRRQAKLHLARIYKKIANRRKDFHFKLANRLCGRYAVICLEDLNIKAMQRLWGKKISDLSHSKFIKILKFKAIAYGVSIIQIPRFYPSSKTCSVCGYVNPKLRLKDRTWICPKCKTHHDRDFNAAVNIQRVGASALGVDTVRPA